MSPKTPESPTKSGLTAKQHRFVEEYLVDLNATQAAIRAGYSERTAKQMGSENLSKPDIASAIQAEQEARSAKLGYTKEWWIERAVENLDRAMTTAQVTTATGQPTGVFTYEGSVANKALELIGRHLGFFAADKVQADINVSGGLIIRVVKE